MNKAATRLVAEPTVVQLGALSINFPNLRARLTKEVGGDQIANQSVKFFAGSNVVCAAAADSNGVASCGGSLQGVRVIPTLGYTAAFDGTEA